MDELSDEELMVLLKRGHPHAFDELYGRHRSGLFLYLLRMCQSRPLAEELLHDILFKIARAAPAYEPRGRFRPWLYRIAANHCLNVLASAPFRAAATVIPLTALTHAEPAAPTSAGPEERAEARETRDTVLAAMAALEPRYRSALLMREVCQMSVEEIASALEAPVGTVKTLLFRGRERLRRALTGRLEEAAR
jgi:RNA polymerase sigma-70 factor (ECF subfamily)